MPLAVLDLANLSNHLINLHTKGVYSIVPQTGFITSYQSFSRAETIEHFTVTPNYTWLERLAR
jgi:hypothetical protein